MIWLILLIKTIQYKVSLFLSSHVNQTSSTIDNHSSNIHFVAFVVFFSFFIIFFHNLFDCYCGVLTFYSLYFLHLFTFSVFYAR